MVLDKETALKTAELLLQINAIKLDPKNPFTWASGYRSPIYCDNRILLSYPSIRTYIKQELSKQLEQQYGKPDVIAGVATGAIGMGALVADYLGLPFVYVRPEPKSHGRQNQVEGQLESGQTVVMIEDLVSTGKSSLNAVQALKKNNARVKGMLAIFTYGFDEANHNFEEKKIPLNTLSNYQYLIEQALKIGYINQSQLKSLTEWRKTPSNWIPL